MKLKGDFITNSSSTAFFFIFNGDRKEDLFKLIRKYKHKFEQSVDYGWGDHEEIHSCNSGYVIDSIDNIITENDKYDEDTQCKIEPISKLIEGNEEQAEYWEKALEKELKSSKKNYQGAAENYKEYADNHRKISAELKEVELKGLTSYLEIEFGDNHGHIRGENAAAMDYNGDDMIIRENDFYLLTENHH